MYLELVYMLLMVNDKWLMING